MRITYRLIFFFTISFWKYSPLFLFSVVSISLCHRNWVGSSSVNIMFNARSVLREFVLIKEYPRGGNIDIVFSLIIRILYILIAELFSVTTFRYVSETNMFTLLRCIYLLLCIISWFKLLFNILNSLVRYFLFNIFGNTSGQNQLQFCLISI